MIWAALGVVVCQVIIMAIMARCVATFGAYTDAVIKAHESNTVLYHQAIKMLQYTTDLLEQERSA